MTLLGLLISAMPYWCLQAEARRMHPGRNVLARYCSENARAVGVVWRTRLIFRYLEVNDAYDKA
jgi:hypothetical protein